MTEKRYQLILVLKSGQKIRPQPVDEILLDSIYRLIADDTAKVRLDLEDSKLMMAMRNIDYLTSTPIED